MKLILDMGLIEVASDAHDCMYPEIRGKLAGEQSKTFISQLKKDQNVDKILKILQFFNHQDGDREFSYMIQIMAGKGPTEDVSNSRVFHIQDSTVAYQSRA